MIRPGAIPKSLSLTGAEIEALKGLSLSIMKPILPEAMTDRLVALGLVSQKLGGFALTREGELQLKIRQR